jgi:hypothetical protein
VFHARCRLNPIDRLTYKATDPRPHFSVFSSI